MDLKRKREGKNLLECTITILVTTQVPGNLSLKPIRIATRRSLFICNFELKLQQLAMTPE